jgi:hypothetical protein
MEVKILFCKALWFWTPQNHKKDFSLQPEEAPLKKFPKMKPFQS